MDMRYYLIYNRVTRKEEEKMDMEFLTFVLAVIQTMISILTYSEYLKHDKF